MRRRSSQNPEPAGLGGAAGAGVGSCGARPKGTGMAVKINRAQREAIYAEAALALSGTGDIRIELGARTFVSLYPRAIECFAIKV